MNARRVGISEKGAGQYSGDVGRPGDIIGVMRAENR